jgi:hypothetical protein
VNDREKQRPTLPPHIACNSIKTIYCDPAATLSAERSIPPELRHKIASVPEINNCNGCERDFALEACADWAAWGAVQKVSNLILNINVYMEDARANKMEFLKSVDIRGNTDESWQRGLGHMLRHYLFQEP